MDTQVLLMHLLSGLSLSGAGNLNRFVAVDTPMTMTNARQYCRSNHVDLASLRDAQDLQQLHDMRSNSTRWIGLNDDPATSMQTIDVYTNSWKWSFEYASGYLNFKSGEPDFKNDEEVCVWMDSDGSWRNQECSSLRHFLCFSGSPSKPDYHLVFEMKTWEDARDHCRFWFVDLAVIKSQKENDHAKSKFWLLFVQLSSNAWIGLYREPWAWQDGSLSEFRHWAPGQPNNMGGNAMCVKLVPDGFICTDCRDVYPFFCTRALKQTILKITISSDLDLTDPNVQDNILQQFGATLTNAGKTDFHLSWSVPPKRKPEPAAAADEEVCDPSSSALMSSALEISVKTTFNQSQQN
ncbi:C-type mannose receptor 2-like isoform X1 [Gadus morhua]|uniref:C-type mannose receptor 2-like n=1 Tax=Gadus morhua TaxID=8049 RepID=A0A8C5F5H2_GADMO|nr:C-type mannose receptor 2-like isoform X1 [Gadus morhua]